MKRFTFVICNLLFVLLFILLASPALAATLSLSPASGTFGKACSFSVNVLLDTVGVETDGTDAILLYDPALLNATSIVNGSIYNDFPGNTIDNSAGKVSVYALAPSTKGFTGKGTIATVNFKTAASASASLATVRVDFDQANPTKTTDSNVIQRSDLKDVLKSVTYGDYTIGSTSTDCNTTTAAVAPKGGPTTLPESGIWEPTMVAGGLGMLLMLIGVFGLKKSQLNDKIQIKNVNSNPKP